jgi:enoyl-CoA hydratase/carnithine racemase
MTDKVIVELRERVLEVRLNRPEKRNALTIEMYEALIGAFERAERDPEVRVLLLSGAGEGFTAGNDLNDFLRATQMEGPPAGFRFIKMLGSFSKPLIAAVHGATIGLGTTLLLHCDFVVAARNTRLQFPFVNLGLVPEAASTLLLPRLAGLQIASELLLLGEAFDAERGHAIGIVNRVVEEADLIATARDIAAKIVARPPNAIRLTKRLLRRETDDVTTRMDVEMADFHAQLTTPELQEAATAFLRKRAPDFSKF